MSHAVAYLVGGCGARALEASGWVAWAIATLAFRGAHTEAGFKLSAPREAGWQPLPQDWC